MTKMSFFFHFLLCQTQQTSKASHSSNSGKLGARARLSRRTDSQKAAGCSYRALQGTISNLLSTVLGYGLIAFQQLSLTAADE